MRHTTAKILLATYSTQLEFTRLVLVKKLKILTPEISSRGFDSLIALLKGRGWLLTSILADGTYVQMTPLGVVALKAQFWALDDQTKNLPTDWYLVLFSRPTKSDPSFRYLRRLLLRYNATQLGRSQYAFSLVIPSEVNLTLQRLYAGSVYVCRVSEWLAGFISPRILGQKQASELITISSGLSKQIDRLLIRFNRNKRLTVNDKKTISGLYDQLVFILKNSQSIHYASFPLVVSPRDLLVKLQQIL